MQPFPWLQEIPLIAIQISKDRHASIGHVLWRPRELNPLGAVVRVVTLEVVCVQKEEDSAASLVPHVARLLRVCRSSQENSALPTTWRPDNNPALGLLQLRVFDEFKAQYAYIESDGLVVLAYYHRDKTECLWHSRMM